MNQSFKHIVLTAIFAAGFVFTPFAAQAGGAMPNEQPSVLDRALLDIQRRNQEQEQEQARLQQAQLQPQVADKNGVVVQEEPAPPVVKEEKTLVVPPQFEEAPIPVAPAPKDRMVKTQDSFFGLSIGAYDPFTNGELAAALGIEWQPGIRIAGFLQPLFGALATHEGAFLGYAGLGVPVELTDNWMLMPSAAFGYYEEGDGVDLGRHGVFRIGTELAYVFANKSRLGLNAHIITNGESLDGDDRTEVISIVYTTPIGFDENRN